MMTISFYFETPVKLVQRRLLKRFLQQELLRLEKLEINSLNIIFCSDLYLLDINRRFLQHDYYTDIITFELKDDVSKKLSGEIYISADRVKENSLAYSTSSQEELSRVIFHGVLHLCGYKDKTKKDKKEMRTKEDHYLKKYKRYVPRGTKK